VCSLHANISGILVTEDGRDANCKVPKIRLLPPPSPCENNYASLGKF